MSFDVGNFVLAALSFVFVVGIVVGFHEYAHYVVGRLFGIRAEAFSIGVGRPLLKRRDRHGTEWMISAIPLGGFVRFAGMGSTGTSKDIAAEGPGSFHGASLLARTLTIAAGPISNFVLAIFIFTGVGLFQPIPQTPATIGGIADISASYTFQTGDELVAINGIEAATPAEFGKLADLPGQLSTFPVEYTVKRGGSLASVAGPPPFAPVITSVVSGWPAEAAGFLVGDVVLRVDEQPISSQLQLTEAIQSRGAEPIVVTVRRGSVSLPLTVTPASTGEGERFVIGTQLTLPFELQAGTPSLREAFVGGVVRTYSIAVEAVSSLASIVKGSLSSCDLQGPVSIAEITGKALAKGPAIFFSIIAAISVIIGIMNLLPVPVLDGGYLVFYAYESITGRRPGPRFMKVAMAAGASAVMTLMAVALVGDFLC